MESREEELGVMETGRNKKNKKIIVAIVILLLLLAAGIGGFFWWQSRSVMDTTSKYWFDKFAQDGMLEGKTPQQIQGILDSIVEEGMFNVSIGTQVVFDDGKSEGSLAFENIQANRYYARVILRRDDDGSTIYKSAGIKPGQFIDGVQLDKNLPKGEYDCTAQVIATDPDNLEDIGQVDVKVKVIVLN